MKQISWVSPRHCVNTIFPIQYLNGGKRVILLSDPDFPHIFMTEPQIKYNNEYLTKVIDELLAEVGLNSSANKTELAKIFWEEFLE
jgi:hypothetical protein